MNDVDRVVMMRESEFFCRFDGDIDSSLRNVDRSSTTSCSSADR